MTSKFVLVLSSLVFVSASPRVVRACESGQLTTLKKDVTVSTKDQSSVVVKAGSQVHIIDKAITDSKVTYKIYVGQDQAGKFISGLGLINETSDVVLACQKTEVKKQQI